MEQRAAEPRNGASLWSVLAGVGAGVVLTGSALFFWRRYKRQRRRERPEADHANPARPSPLLQLGFLEHISHEIRTPLAGILGYAEQLLIDSPLSSPQLAKLQALHRCARSLSHLVDDMLDLSKLDLEQNPLVLHAQDFSLAELLDDLRKQITVEIGDAPVSFALRFETAVPQYLHGDPVRTRQMLVHLLRNALRLMHEGDLTLSVNAVSLPGKRELALSFSLSATPVEAMRIIAHFQSEGLVHDASENSTLMHPISSGRGFYVSKRLAQQLGGDVNVLASKTGEGGALNCRIIAQAAPESPLIEGSRETPSLQEDASDLRVFAGKLQGLSILLVEDGLDNQRIFSYFLRLAGARVTIEADGSKALDRLRFAEIFDIVLMDIQLPLIDGVAVTRQLRSEGYARPIIAVSAHSLHDEKAHRLEQGFDDFLTKPVEIEKLIRLLMLHGGGAGAQAPGAECVPPSSEPASALGEEGGVLHSKYHDKPIYRQMLIEFADGLDERWRLAASHLEAKEWTQVSRLMHQMRGAAATYGYPQLSTLAAAIELATTESQMSSLVPDDVERQFKELIRLCGHIKAGAPREPQ